MFSYTLKRLGQTVLVLIGITLITFLLLNVVPGDPVAMMLDKRADDLLLRKSAMKWDLMFRFMSNILILWKAQ